MLKWKVARWVNGALLSPYGTNATGVSAEAFGASPSASAAINTAAIQAALNQTGLVTLSTHGTYQINKTLLINSYTQFDTGLGVVIYLANGSLCNSIRNYYAQNALDVSAFSVSGGVATVTEYGHSRVSGNYIYIEGATGNTNINGPQLVTGVNGNTWTFSVSGSNPTNTAGGARIFIAPYNPLAASNFVRSTNVVTVTETGHKRNVGDHVYITGLATDTSFNGANEIVTVTDGTSWAYASTGSNGSPTGTAQLLGDTQIYLDLDAIDGNVTGNTVDALASVNITLGNVGNSSLTANRILNGGSRAAQFFNCGNIVVPYAFVHGTKGSLQFESSCNNIRLGKIAAGNTTDDVVAWGVTSSSVGTAVNTASPCGPGSMGTLLIDSIIGNSPTGNLKLYCYTGYNLGTVKIGSIMGTGRAIGSDSGSGTSGGTIDNLIIDKIDVTPNNTEEISFAGLTMGIVRLTNVTDRTTGSNPVILNTNNITTLQLDKCSFLTSPTIQSITLGTGISISEMIVSNSNLTSGNGGNFLALAGTFAGGTLKFDNVRFDGTPGYKYGNLFYTNGGIFDNVIFNNVTINNCQTLVFSTATVTMNFWLNNVMVESGGVYSLFNDNSGGLNGQIRFNNLNATAVSHNVFDFSGNGTWNIEGTNITYTAGKFAAFGGTTTTTVNCPDALIDLSKVTRTAGCLAKSTGNGTIAAGNLAVCDATGAAGSWKQLSNTTLNY